MNNYIKFKDAATVSVPKGVSGKKYIKTKDSTSKSGHSLIAQIEMTHAGIITRNMGFYLPDNMKRGAHTFLKDYKKPVLVGHDEDTDPVGRVIDANYRDTSHELKINDKYLASMMEWYDKKKGGQGLTDFVQYVVQEYHSSDKYRGLGHILGTLKISDEEAIAKVLDERYLTVSTSMTSDKARCSECGQDWIADGACEHERGQIYDSGVPVLLVPGSQSYNHVGFVSEPADVFAAGFKGVEIVKDGTIEELDSNKEFTDKFMIAANLFSHNGNKLISLSDEHNTDLIQVKNNIQEIEDSLNNMENMVMTKKEFADQIEATISLYMNGEDGEMSTSRVSKYLKELSPEMLAEMAQKAMAALDSKDFEGDEAKFKDALSTFIESEIPAEDDSSSEEGTVEDSTSTEEPVKMKAIKIISDKFKVVNGDEYEASLEDSVLEEILKIEDADLTKKDAKELAKIIVRSERGDAITNLTLDSKEKEVAQCVAEFIELKDRRFKLADTSEEEILAKMNEFISDDNKISEETFGTLEAKDCAGSSKYFPINSTEAAEAAKKVLGLAISADSLKGRILGNIEKLSADFADSKEDTSSSAENFDTTNDGCDNQLELSDEKLLEDLNKLLETAEERDLLDSVLASHLKEKQQEIEILEQQLDLANDDVERLEGEISTFKEAAKKQLATQVVDAKISSGLFAVEDRESEITKHLERSEDSLKDMANDFGALPKLGKETQTEEVTNPVLEDSATSANEQLIKDEKKAEEVHEDKRKKDLLKKYNLLKASKGKKYADAWLNRQA